MKPHRLAASRKSPIRVSLKASLPASLKASVMAWGAAAALAAPLAVVPLGVARADEAYTLRVDAPAAKAGVPSSARVVIKPGAGRHINKEFPTSVKLVPPTGVELPKATVSARDSGKVEEQEATIEVKYTARDAGKKSFTGTARFAVCTATSCDPRSVPINFDVDVH